MGKTKKIYPFPPPDVPVVLEIHLKVDVLLKLGHLSLLVSDLGLLAKAHVLQDHHQ